MLQRFSLWWHHFVQGIIWNSFLSRFEFLDWVVFFAVGIGIIYGIKKGFWKVLSDVFRISAVIAVTMEFYDELNGLISPYLTMLPAGWTSLLSFLLLALAAWLVTYIFAAIFKKVLTAKTSSLVRFFGGLVLGSLFAFIVVGFIVQSVMLIPGQSIRSYFSKEDSYLGSYLIQVAPQIHKAIVEPIQFAAGKMTSYTS